MLRSVLIVHELNSDSAEVFTLPLELHLSDGQAKQKKRHSIMQKAREAEMRAALQTLQHKLNWVIVWFITEM